MPRPGSCVVRRSDTDSACAREKRNIFFQKGRELLSELSECVVSVAATWLIDPIDTPIPTPIAGVVSESTRD